MSSPITRYWDQFIRSRSGATERPQHYYDSFYFGSEETCSSITRLVLSGVKTATGSLLWVYEAEGKRPPRQGDFSIVTDARREPLCIIETVEAHIIPYEEVDAAFAWDGGEGDRSLESWRQIYWEYIVAECARIGREPSPKTPLVCERFRVVYKEPRGD